MPEARIEIDAEDGFLEAFVAWPQREGRAPPAVLLGGRDAGAAAEVERMARRLAARGYFTLVPEWRSRPPEARRGDAEAWLDYLACERRVEDARVGVAGWGAGADLALKVAAWRSERIAAAAAFHGRGFTAARALDVAQRINAIVHLGYLAGAESGRGPATLEAALCAADVVFEAEAYAPDDEARMRAALLELFDRTLPAPRGGPGAWAVAAPP